MSICAFLALGAVNAIAGPVTFDLQARTIFGFDTTGQHRTTDTYQTGPGGIGTSWTGTVSLLPANVIYQPGTANLPTNYFDALSTAFGTGWTYASAANELSDGSIEIHTYDALSSKHNGATSGMCDPCVGAEIDLQYVPGVATTDPTANMHWIQVILTTTRSLHLTWVPATWRTLSTLRRSTSLHTTRTVTPPPAGISSTCPRATTTRRPRGWLTCSW